MAGGRAPEQTGPMLTPIVTEIPRILEPVARDTFIGARERSNVVRFPARELRDRPATLVPRAA